MADSQFIALGKCEAPGEVIDSIAFLFHQGLNVLLPLKARLKIWRRRVDTTRVGPSNTRIDPGAIHLSLGPASDIGTKCEMFNNNHTCFLHFLAMIICTISKPANMTTSMPAMTTVFMSSMMPNSMLYAMIALTTIITIDMTGKPVESGICWSHECSKHKQTTDGVRI